MTSKMQYALFAYDDDDDEYSSINMNELPLLLQLMLLIWLLKRIQQMIMMMFIIIIIMCNNNIIMCCFYNMQHNTSYAHMRRACCVPSDAPANVLNSYACLVLSLLTTTYVPYVRVVVLVLIVSTVFIFISFCRFIMRFLHLRFVTITLFVHDAFAIYAIFVLNCCFCFFHIHFHSCSVFLYSLIFVVGVLYKMPQQIEGCIDCILSYSYIRVTFLMC